MTVGVQLEGAAVVCDELRHVSDSADLERSGRK